MTPIAPDHWISSSRPRLFPTDRTYVAYLERETAEAHSSSRVRSGSWAPRLLSTPTTRSSSKQARARTPRPRSTTNRTDSRPTPAPDCPSYFRCRLKCDQLGNAHWAAVFLRWRQIASIVPHMTQTVGYRANTLLSWLEQKDPVCLVWRRIEDGDLR